MQNTYYHVWFISTKNNNYNILVEGKPLYYVSLNCCFSFFIFFKDFIYLLLERGEGREKERERNISV